MGIFYLSVFVKAAKHGRLLSQHYWLLPSHTVTKGNEERHASGPGQCVSLLSAPSAKATDHQNLLVCVCLFVCFLSNKIIAKVSS